MFSVQFTMGRSNHGQPVSSAALIDGSCRSETCDGVSTGSRRKSVRGDALVICTGYL
jgi:hypothetical protein